MPHHCSVCGHPLNNLDDLVRHRLPNASPEELEVAKEHVRRFLEAAIRQFGNLPRDRKEGEAKESTSEV